MQRSEKTRTDQPSDLSVYEPWVKSWQEIAADLQMSEEEGLSKKQVKERQRRCGPNRLRTTRSKSAWLILVDQVKNLIVLLLVVAAVLSFSFGQWVEGVAIVAVIIINTAIGFFTELKAARSMEALQQMSRVTTKVRRDGSIREVNAEELVPGDLVVLEGGDVVTADLRLMEASRLQADESPLTGESVPVGKGIEPISEDAPLAERKNMLFKGTAVTSGSGHGIVVATGMQTELGHISELTEEAEEELSPLEKRLHRLGYRLVWITLGIAALLIAVGIITGKEVLLIIETSIALAVAAIPEGLPIVATIALARGMWRMARHNALLNRLSAVETLGATTIIFTDKTGTLTENRMTVSRLALATGGEADTEDVEVIFESDGVKFLQQGDSLEVSDHQGLREALETGVLCNNASLYEQEDDKAAVVGDPLEVALLEVGSQAGIKRSSLLESMPELREEAFDQQLKLMATFHQEDDHKRVAVKGAPEAVIEACTHLRTEEGSREISEQEKKKWLQKNDKLAEEGLRVLGLAAKEVGSKNAKPYVSLIFLGLVGLLDPPRKSVATAMSSCREAGIRAIMVTGDQAVTARNVGRSVGLVEEKDPVVVEGKELESAEKVSEEDKGYFLEADIFARVSPKQKLDLIALHQRNGAVVAMTGDGVNDAPALKKADIGVAMGRRGTQVAREAADMVLKDDSFATIVVAVEEGRAIFENIRKFILFLLSGNAGEIMIVAFALLAGAPLPILPLQILYLNMIGDVFPALALGVGKGDPSKMVYPPRDPGEPILAGFHWFAVFSYGFVIAVAVLGSFALALHWLQVEAGHAVTISFLTLAFARLWHVFNMRDPESTILRNDVTRNPFVWGALALCIGLLLIAVYLPGLSDVLDLVNPGNTGWLLIIAMSMVPLLIGQLIKVRFVRKLFKSFKPFKS